MRPRRSRTDPARHGLEQRLVVLTRPQAPPNATPINCIVVAASGPRTERERRRLRQNSGGIPIIHASERSFQACALAPESPGRGRTITCPIPHGRAQGGPGSPALRAAPGRPFVQAFGRSGISTAILLPEPGSGSDQGPSLRGPGRRHEDQRGIRKKNLPHVAIQGQIESTSACDIPVTRRGSAFHSALPPADPCFRD